MTQYPEVVLARELEMCYVNVALVTDYDAGLEGDPSVAAVSVADVISVITANNERVRHLILAMIERMPTDRSCSCGEAMSSAFVS
jgi:5'-methylthioadenosine phosphorylase